MLSGVATQSFNNVFSATYTNYKIVISCKTASSINLFSLRLRASGTDNTSSNYYYQTFGADTSQTAIVLNRQDPGDNFRIGVSGNDGSISEVTISEPFSSNKTSYSQSSASGVGTNEGHFEVGGGFFSGTTSFDGFTMFVPGLNITGEVSIYGFNK